MNLTSLLAWSKSEFHHLPWRKNRSLYRTLVSEIMLQQTTVGTVLNHFERFLKRFPDLESLASASEEELIVAWKGLGYYRRARNLKKIAEHLFREHAGEFPSTVEELQKIPGIGPYTANALVAIGQDKRGLAVDANLERVIARLFGIKMEKGPKLQQEIQRQFLEKKIFNHKVSWRELNESLMDLGRTFCQARKASCELCPLKKDCLSFKQGAPLLIPMSLNPIKKKVMEHEVHLLRIIVTKKGKILVYQKQKDQWLSGQYEVPTYILSSTDKSLKQYPSFPSKKKPNLGPSFKTGITKYKIKNSLLKMTEKEFLTYEFPYKKEWREMNSEHSNLSTATIKALAKIVDSNK